MGRKEEKAKVKMKASPVTIGVQVGGPMADRATNGHILALRRVMDEHFRGQYSPEVDEFALLLRIPGEVGNWEWFVEGCSRLRRSRRDRYFSIDIGIPRDRWENVPASMLREFIANCIREAVGLFIAKLKKDKSPVDEAALLRDCAEAMKTYCSK
jgi:hypothetical protein